jgi:type I restriction enzyme S subunit
MKMKKYDSYKNSGIEWLGEIPKHWEVIKLGYVFRAKKGNNASKLTKEFCGKIPGKFNVYSGQTENNGIMDSINFFEFNYEENGCLFTTTVGAKAMTIKYLQEKFSLSQNCMIMFSKKDFIYIKFFYYHLQPLFSYERKFIPDHMQASFRMEDFYQFKSALPPKQEQEKIASFLDEKTTKIDELIKQKEKLIKLLKERKEVVINDAVTKGLNKNVKMKNSGIEWLGEIPEHWEVMKITHIFNEIGSGTTPNSSNTKYYNGNINWLQTGDLTDNIIFKTSKKITNKALKDYSTLKIYPKNSIVIAMYGATIGKVGLLNIETTTNQACCVLSKSKKVLEKYAFYWFISSKKDIISMGYGGGQPNISQNLIKSLKMQVPPLNEQKQIVEYIENEVSKIDKAVELQQNYINKLKEYKTTLIDNVVTGKVKVV